MVIYVAIQGILHARNSEIIGMRVSDASGTGSGLEVWAVARDVAVIV